MNTQELAQSNLDRLTELRNKFAGLADYVGVSAFDWRAMMESGALASVHVSRYRGLKPLTAQDLGLALDLDKIDQVIALGDRLLLPKPVLAQFNTLETRARQVLRQYTLKTPAGLFLPAGAYEPAYKAILQFRIKFWQLVDDLLVKLPEHKETMRAEYINLARQVLAQNTDPGEPIDNDWIVAFADRCLADFPTVEELKRSFDMALRLEFVPAYLTDQAYEQPSYVANPTRDMLNLRSAVLQDARDARKELISGFLSSVESEIFTMVNAALTDVLRSIQDNGSLISRNSEQLKNLVAKISQLNFWEDKRLEAIQAEITALLDKPAKAKRDLEVDTAILAELQEQTRSFLIKANVGNQRTGFDVQADQANVSLDRVGVKREWQAPADLDLSDPAEYLTPDSLDANGNIVYRDVDGKITKIRDRATGQVLQAADDNGELVANPFLAREIVSTEDTSVEAIAQRLQIAAEADEKLRRVDPQAWQAKKDRTDEILAKLGGSGAIIEPAPSAVEAPQAPQPVRGRRLF